MYDIYNLYQVTGPAFAGELREARIANAPPWDELVSHEPRLSDLLEVARSQEPDKYGNYCGYDAFMHSQEGQRSLRYRIEMLVGRRSKHLNPIMHTKAALWRVIDTIMHALPECSGKCGSDHTCPWI